MSEIPFRATVNDGAIPIPENVEEQLEIEDGDVVTASILLNSGSIGSAEELGL